MFHVEPEVYGLRFPLTGHQTDQLSRFEALLTDRARTSGLVSRGDADRIRTRHILDSLRAAPCLPPSPAEVADVGSGAGLPGIPLAIARPDLMWHLIEPQRRRVAFLEFAVEALNLANVRVRATGAEGVDERFPVAVARALADPLRTWQRVEPILQPDGLVIYFAGRSWSPVQEAILLGHGVRCTPCAGAAGTHGGPIVMMGRSEPERAVR